MRPHCSAAAWAIRCQCARRFSARAPFNWSTLRCAAMGLTRQAPSSTAFSTTQSILSPAGRPWTSVMRPGNSASRGTCAPSCAQAALPSISSVAGYSPPAPSNSTSAAPARSRSTRTA
ncbi:Uncharacterised protein [Bordetella pertussis]|nr:Uncharacterised protein [Bordetella pertussis]